MFDFEALSHAIASQTVLCVGDLMLDEFVYGEVSRISPEAPAPVIAVQRSETNIGGAGNVARNVASLGARCIFVGLIGEDDAAAQLKTALARESGIDSVLVCDPTRPTTRKVRFVSEHFSTHMLRADWELAQPASAEIEQKLIDAILPLLARADIVLLSDYAKGVLTARVIRNVIDAARKLGKRVIVDPKSANFAIYRGATLLTPNRKEFAEATRSRADTRNKHRRCGAGRDAACGLRGDAGDAKRARHDAGAAQGRGHPCSGSSGEGARRLGRGRYRRRGARGGACGGGRLGDRVADGERGGGGRGRQEGHGQRDVGGIAPQDPAACLSGGGRKDCRRGGDLDAQLLDWRKQGLRVGFTNGCFDILHPGHVKVLTAARGRLRPADRWPQQRRVGEAAEGRGTSGPGRARARGSAGGAGGGRSRRDLRGRHSDRADHARSSRACW